MNAFKITCSIINFLLVVLNFFITKLYDKFSKKKNPHYETIKRTIGMISSIVTFIITMILSLITYTSSAALGITNLVICFITTTGKLVFNWIEFYKEEKEKENYKSYNGVFAVSAIIITKNNKFILVKRKNVEKSSTSDDLWIQPGVYYRTNTLHKNPEELLPFYDELIKSMQKECGLSNGSYKPLQLNSIVKSERNTFAGENIKIWNAQYMNNKLSHTPFLIQVEKTDETKRSNTSTHIDCFYAFELSIEDEKVLDDLKSLIPEKKETIKYSDICAFTLEEIEDMSRSGTGKRCYPDLAVIVEEFLKLWRQSIFENKFKEKIRHCTFNPNNNTFWLRLNNSCNLNCQFCLMKNRAQDIRISSIDVGKLKQYLKKQSLPRRKYHLIITGGEPLLISNLDTVIENILNNTNGKISSVSVCTNGTFYDNAAINNMINGLIVNNKKYKDKLKFVINFSSYDDASFERITQSTLFEKQKAFIQFLHSNNIHNITANVVMTNELEENLEKYFNLWIDLGIKDIAFSYAIQLGIDNRNTSSSIRTLKKSECVNLYSSLGNGMYPIEYFNKIELMIPSCDEKNSCKENPNIISCDITDDDTANWSFEQSCLDIK